MADKVQEGDKGKTSSVSPVDLCLLAWGRLWRCKRPLDVLQWHPGSRGTWGSCQIRILATRTSHILHPASASAFDYIFSYNAFIVHTCITEISLTRSLSLLEMG
jgi:hypothetical protein